MELLLTVLVDLRDFFNHHVIFTIGILLLSGFFMGRLAQMVKLPALTGYILAGLFLGGSASGIVREEVAESLTGITEIALGLIALTIGAEFNMVKIRRIGGRVVVITIFQALFAFVLVTAGLRFAGLALPFALLLGGIAVATDPATTVIIARDLRARGKFIDYLYGVVALDDAVCVILFSIVFSLAAGMLKGAAGSATLVHNLLHVAGEITMSVVAGLIAGALLHMLTFRKYKINEILLISLGVMFTVTAIAVVMKFSLIITNMTMGALLINLSLKNRRIFNILEPLTPPVFALFFIIAGTELSITVFTQGLIMFWGAVFLITRFVGKTSGVYVSSIITGAPDSIRKYLGLCLFPQAGVSIGLVLFVQSSPVITESALTFKGIPILVILVNIVLLNVLVNELIGPIITRYGLKKGADL